MAAVRQQVLNWLYSVLTSEYRDVNRTYNDVAQTLSFYSSLSPRTDVYTFEDGSSALLLHLSGTIPVNFRGTTYRFPIALWIPHGYPREAPLVYVTPTEAMVVRPGQHVDPQGKIYHPYLVGWAEFWDKSNILDFLAVMRDVFAKEPPVISRRHQSSAPQPQQATPPPPRPPLPPERARPQSGPSISSMPAQAPLPPPKPSSNSQQNVSTSSLSDRGSPLPPLPSQSAYGNGQYGTDVRSSVINPYAPQRSSSLRHEAPPPLPPQPHRQFTRDSSKSPVSPITPPGGPYARPNWSQNNLQSRFTSNPLPHPGSSQHGYPASQHPLSTQQHYSSPPGQWQQQQSPYPFQNQTPPQQRQKPAPPPDLLDAPLDFSIPTTTQPAPPIPPNPEKDHILHSISVALVTQRQHTRTQGTSALPGLSAQHSAMLTSLQNMQAEIAALEGLTSLLNTNTSILHSALRDADAVIESSQHRTAPNIDELLVAPTVVGNQLYEQVNEERSLGDALFVLGRAVERGRVSATVFAKMTRTLAREWFLKKALARKIGRGMGLNSY